MKVRHEISSVSRYDRVLLVLSDTGPLGSFIAQPDDTDATGENYAVKIINVSSMPGARHAARKNDIGWFTDALGFPDEADKSGLFLPAYAGAIASFQRPGFRGKDDFEVKSFFEIGHGSVLRIIEEQMDIIRPAA